MASAIRAKRRRKLDRAVTPTIWVFEPRERLQHLSDQRPAFSAQHDGDRRSIHRAVVQFNDQRAAGGPERLSAIRADRVKDVTDQFKRQTEILGAGDNAVAKFLIEGRHATEDLIKKFSDLGASSQQIQTAASAVRELTAAQISGAQAQFAKGLREQNDQLLIQRVAVVSGTEAAIAQSAALLRVKAADVGLTDAIKKEIAVLAQRQLAFAQANVVDSLERENRALAVQFVTMTQGATAGRELALQLKLHDTGLASLTPKIEAAAEKQRQWNEQIDTAALNLRNLQQEIERTRPLMTYRRAPPLKRARPGPVNQIQRLKLPGRRARPSGNDSTS
jgi:hypothetical protein